MNIITIPELVGDYISATYCNGVLIDSKGREWEHCKEINAPGFDQTIVFVGKIITLKDGREIAVFEDFKTFGKSKLFPLYSQVLEFIELVGLYCPVPYPILRDMPDSVLCVWAINQPYKFTKLMKILDSKPGVPEYVDISSTGKIVKVIDIKWSLNTEMNYIPVIYFDDSVGHLGDVIKFKEMKSALALKMNGIKIGCRVVVYDKWIKNLDVQPVYYPTRCPNCNSAFKETTFHLTCLICKRTKDATSNHNGLA